jgi:hypothetical protein
VRKGDRIALSRLLEAVADEERLYFNEELRDHCKLAVFFDPKGATP